jgi:DnaK suppressor protein
MDAMQQQAMAQASERQRSSELASIQAALARIEAGEYGLCIECEEEIGEKRLEANPAVGLCLACAARSEG